MSQNLREEKIDIVSLYGQDAFTTPDNMLVQYETSLDGLSASRVEEHLKRYGFNEMKQAKEKKWYHYFFSSLFSPFNLILLGITLVLFYTDVILTTPSSYANIIVIFLLITASTLLEFWEVYKSNKAATKLKNLVAISSTVIRDGKKQNIPLREVTIRRYRFTFCWRFNPC